MYLDFKALNKHLLYPEFCSTSPLHDFLLEFLLDSKTKGTAAEHFLQRTNLISSLWCQSRGLLHLVWGFPACCAHLRLVLDEEHRYCLELWFQESVAFCPVSASHLGIFSAIKIQKKKSSCIYSTSASSVYAHSLLKLDRLSVFIFSLVFSFKSFILRFPGNFCNTI